MPGPVFKTLGWSRWVDRLSGLDQVNQINQVGQADRDSMTRWSERAGYVRLMN